MHVNVPLCLNDVDLRVSIVTFVVYCAKVIVAKSLCLDYVHDREALSHGCMSETRFQCDKGNVLTRLNYDIFCCENIDNHKPMSGPRLVSKKINVVVFYLQAAIRTTNPVIYNYI